VNDESSLRQNLHNIQTDNLDSLKAVYQEVKSPYRRLHQPPTEEEYNRLWEGNVEEIEE
jgi:hypothetical protein